MAKQDKLETAIRRGLDYLATAQRTDGGFDSFSSPSSTNFTKDFTYQTSFVPAVMLTALSGVEVPRARRVTRGLTRFIRVQASPHWSYNYWSRSAAENQSHPYPDDLDDTACAFLGLLTYDISKVSPEMLAAFVKLLLATETKPGGPYRTWLAARSAKDWQDVDLAVNANVAAVLRHISQPLPALTAFMEQAIESHEITSPYYVSAYPLLYFLARACTDAQQPKLLEVARIIWAEDTGPTPLHGALLLTTLTTLEASKGAPLVRLLLETQQPDGSWPAEAFCLDPTRNNQTHYQGSENLSTALALEALYAYHQADAQEPVLAPDSSSLKADPDLQFPVLSSARRDCQKLGPELQKGMLDFLRRIAGSSVGAEIVNLPQLFNQSLQQPLTDSQQPYLVRLGLANLYGWTAYTILDDFLDDAGYPLLLPAATAALRFALLTFLEDTHSRPQADQLIQQMFNTIDSANAWEITRCRFKHTAQYLQVAELPDYGDTTELANRSLGHALPPLLILLARDMPVESDQFQAVQQAFTHYLAARQLNDDLHDWQEDIKNGHVTFVVSRILSGAEIKPGPAAWRTLLPKLQHQFWYRSLPSLCQEVRHQTILARDSLAGLEFLKPHNIITELLDNIETSIDQTLAAQNRAQRFLKHYRGAAP